MFRVMLLAFPDSTERQELLEDLNVLEEKLNELIELEEED